MQYWDGMMVTMWLVVTVTANLNECSLQGNNECHLFTCLVMMDGDIIISPAVTLEI